MSDEMTTPGLGKRERLIKAAQKCMLEQGVETTKLADIAHAAKVPPGNVYYYFKTRDELVAAAVEDHAEQIRTMLANLGQHQTPQNRLKALLEMLAENRESIAQNGCAIGNLCTELGRRNDDLGRSSAHLLTLLINWTRHQLEQIGTPDADDLALALLGAYEGAALLSHSLRDPQVIQSEVRRLKAWIDSM
ncbi:MAG TPA: TetR/AcrR family transcriptional regulator [Acidimicrobiales bacterium]|jgi:TetR/AcrR family transcriptional repressor of nem operon|nr:TetR/AcrR family transcriptional regulator [Acidimicrobiales bacterium]